jgi:hypothetical protein
VLRWDHARSIFCSVDIIDNAIGLDEDWTAVYYDGEPVTEYSWTDGALGGGGGALDVAAVDLFANGSTSVCYDNLSLRPASPERARNQHGAGRASDQPGTSAVPRLAFFH